MQLKLLQSCPTAPAPGSGKPGQGCVALWEKILYKLQAPAVLPQVQPRSWKGNSCPYLHVALCREGSRWLSLRASRAGGQRWAGALGSGPATPGQPWAGTPCRAACLRGALCAASCIELVFVLICCLGVSIKYSLKEQKLALEAFFFLFFFILCPL